jgi:organic hydroperoxide reductase OsmC/OhrA
LNKSAIVLSRNFNTQFQHIQPSRLDPRVAALEEGRFVDATLTFAVSSSASGAQIHALCESAVSNCPSSGDVNAFANN